MKAVLVDVPAALLRERRQTGAAKFDEMWGGVVHMVPPPSALHQRVASQLHRLLAPLAEARGLVAFYETGLFRSDDDYRVPDQLYVRPELVTGRGVEGPAELVVELRSPNDETDEKIDCSSSSRRSDASSCCASETGGSFLSCPTRKGATDRMGSASGSLPLLALGSP